MNIYDIRLKKRDISTRLWHKSGYTHNCVEHYPYFIFMLDVLSYLDLLGENDV